MCNIKICGIKRLGDITVLNQYAPEFVGFVFAKSKRQITKDTAKTLREKLLPNIKTVGVFVNHNIEEIEELLKAGIINVAQLHGAEDESYIAALKSRTHCLIIKAVKVYSIKDILLWENTNADFLLLDNGEGGTGKTFSWDILKELRENHIFKKPFFIAGGLNIENVIDAVKFAPFGVDVSSGVETDGAKDSNKIKEFIKAVRTAQN